MNSDLTLLASAYLDDHVTIDERAQVESDPVLLAEVERLRAVRLLVAKVEPAKISLREAHLAAAFDVWDRRSDATSTGLGDAAAAGAASVSAPTRLRDRRRTVSTRWLTGAAAALVLVAVGGVALQSAGSGNDDTSTDAAATDATESTDAAQASTDDASTFAGEAQPDAGDAASAADDLPEAAVTDGSVRLDTAVDDPPPPREEAALQQLRTLQDLADFAAPAFGAPRAPDAPAATSAPVDSVISEGSILELTLCLGADIVVGPAVYGDVVVVVGIDEGRALAFAYQPESCTEIARVRLDAP